MEKSRNTERFGAEFLSVERSVGMEKRKGKLRSSVLAAMYVGCLLSFIGPVFPACESPANAAVVKDSAQNVLSEGKERNDQKRIQKKKLAKSKTEKVKKVKKNRINRSTVPVRKVIVKNKHGKHVNPTTVGGKKTKKVKKNESKAISPGAVVRIENPALKSRSGSDVVEMRKALPVCNDFCFLGKSSCWEPGGEATLIRSKPGEPVVLNRGLNIVEWETVPVFGNLRFEDGSMILKRAVNAEFEVLKRATGIAFSFSSEDHESGAADAVYTVGTRTAIMVSDMVPSGTTAKYRIKVRGNIAETVSKGKNRGRSDESFVFPFDADFLVRVR